MKTLLIVFFLSFSSFLYSQELIKGIHFNMSKSEAKEIIVNNEEALKITIGNVEFGKPGVIASDGLTKVIDFGEKFKIGDWSDKGKDATYNKIKDLKTFFLNKNYVLVYENSLTDANNWLGAAQGNALLFKKDSIFLSVIFTGQNTIINYQTTVRYSLNLRITSILLDPVLFKRWFAISAPETNKKADNVF